MKDKINEICGLLLFIAFLIVIPYKEFFNVSRTMTVSTLVALLFLAVVIPFFLIGKKKFNLIISVTIMGIIIFGLFKFADHRALKSIVDIKRMIWVFQSKEKIIDENLNLYNEYRKEKSKVYNPG